MWSGLSGSSDLLLPYSIIPLASHITTILISTLFQTHEHMYLCAEVVPLVCARLQCEKRARKAILLGSCVPLGMCITWTAIALGLAPFDEELFRQASMAGVAYVNVLIEF